MGGARARMATGAHRAPATTAVANERSYHRAAMTTLDDAPPIRLTDLTECGGCAAKLGADLLAEALAGLRGDTDADASNGGAAAADPALIAGLTPPDDAAAYRVSDDVAVIGTVDFFPPLVDDPRTYGAIAAANAISDVY